MKKVYILFVALILMNGAIAQWLPQNSGTTKILNSVFFTDANTGYAVGDSGTILKTNNGGLNWIPQNSGTNLNLISVHFPAPDTGYAVGGIMNSASPSSIILKTTNGGINWIPKTSGTTAQLNSVFFTDINVGFTVGQQVTIGVEQILKTTDGGENWIIHPDTVNGLSSVHFPNANIGYASSCCGIYKTIDGGNNWIEIFGNTTYLSSVYFINADTGWAVGGSWGNGVIMKTINGGVDWATQSNVAWWGLRSVYFVDADTGYAVGPEILKTTNGGADWTNQPSPDFLYSVYFPDSITGYAVGNSGTIIKTTNGGYVGINSHNQTTNNLTLYPNPAGDKVIIETNTQGSLIILSISGSQLMQQEIAERATTFDISNLNNGIYIVKLIGERGIQVVKMIKE